MRHDIKYLVLFVSRSNYLSKTSIHYWIKRKSHECLSELLFDATSGRNVLFAFHRNASSVPAEVDFAVSSLGSVQKKRVGQSFKSVYIQPPETKDRQAKKVALPSFISKSHDAPLCAIGFSPLEGVTITCSSQSIADVTSRKSLLRNLCFCLLQFGILYRFHVEGECPMIPIHLFVY